MRLGSTLRSFTLWILLSLGTTSACAAGSDATPIIFTGTFLSSSEVNGKLPPFAHCARAETITSLMAGPDENACTLRDAALRHHQNGLSMTMLIVFCRDHGGWNATVIGHQPLSLSHAPTCAVGDLLDRRAE